MSFLFATSHLPAVKRPQIEEEEEDQAQPMQRSGGVRAISHLEEPVRRDSSVPLSQRGAQAMGRNVQIVKPTGPRTLPADGVAAAKASGIFDAVRHQYNQGGNEHFMDENGQLQPRNESRSQTFPFPAARDRDNGAAVDHKVKVSDHTPRSQTLPLGRLFDKRLPPGFRDPATDKPTDRYEIPFATFRQKAANTGAQQQVRSPQQTALNGSLGAAQQAPAPDASVVQQNTGTGTAPKVPTANSESSALQEHNRVRRLDESDPGKPPKQRVEGTASENKPREQFEREKAAYEKAKATATTNHHLNHANEQTLKAWENYDRAMQLMEQAPEGKKVLDHLRNDKTRVFKVIMVNDPVNDSYMGIKMKPGARGQHVNTGMKDEQGRDVHVIFLSAPALARDAATAGGKINPDAEALEDVWHELYHASERKISDSVDPLNLGTARSADRLTQQSYAHERRAVRFENIIRARNGGIRMKNKYGGSYVRGPDGQNRIVNEINVPEAQPPWIPAPMN